MSERKVLNKYYPPDFDPAKVPKLRQHRERQYTVRTMAPFNMRCKTCGDYIYQGKKFNAKTENVQDETYLGLRIYRFYIKCPKCISEISFKTDPENEDYTIENGATRLFEAAKMLRKAEEQEKQDREEEEANNPMKVLENRTKDSKNEMEILENLEELREINTRKLDIDYAEILRRKAEAQGEMLRKQEEEDEAYVAKLFGKQDGGVIKRIEDDPDEVGGASSSWLPSSKKTSAVKRPSDVLTSDDKLQTKKSKQESTGLKLSSKSALAGLVKVKKQHPKSNLPSTKTTPRDSTSTQDNNVALATQTEVGIGETRTHEQTVPEPVREPSTSSQSLTTTVAGGSNDSNHHDDHHQDNNHHHVNDIPEPDSDQISRSIQEGLGKKLIAGGGQGARPKAKSVGLSLLGGYTVSDDSNDSDESDN
ncbi:splicing factor YJU2-like [Patiria miniata]|uniref:Splicing factor YJU2 n=1 Tax=Patiria miniata TaxID=46514 RepID=A0A914AIW9_PATMI|nr:splicing factor YJU2-like [Patiria miniata]XP_038063591.1 splicing factor YJU2-like [Patiria miniata]XP_038063592.1 splicing factor YJU2-like [Patiria miniata]XP_038063593.1 splicing factor YJU2-like [Patiria miniata]